MQGEFYRLARREIVRVEIGSVNLANRGWWTRCEVRGCRRIKLSGMRVVVEPYEELELDEESELEP